MSSLPYHEPSIIQVLVLSSFLLALNVIDAILDRALYCGLVGQVLIGGAPGGNLLSPDLLNAVLQLGYLGLILIVFEGGASTFVEAVRRNLVLSASGLADTRLGSVLGTAAMMDDVLGLVMVQIVSSLGAVAGGGDGEVRIDIGNTVLRPVLVSLAIAVAVPLACRFVLKPLLDVARSRDKSASGNGKSEEMKAPWWLCGGFLDKLGSFIC
ncbi:hypothetical protein F5Y06DRAFT_308451 [Hypoxylon sp. FL0890]|nr:hypothetical protein F5Y06DRAFT_308451 [Hypoxylon sp. FL0890]